MAGPSGQTRRRTRLKLRAGPGRRVWRLPRNPTASPLFLDALIPPVFQLTATMLRDVSYQLPNW